jgi:hypothetical protein
VLSFGRRAEVLTFESNGYLEQFGVGRGNRGSRRALMSLDQELDKQLLPLVSIQRATSERHELLLAPWILHHPRDYREQSSNLRRDLLRRDPNDAARQELFHCLVSEEVSKVPSFRRRPPPGAALSG